MQVIVPEKANITSSPSFTRTGQAAYIDYRGDYRWAESGQIRFNHRLLEYDSMFDTYPVVFEGAMCEPKRKNLWVNNAEINGTVITPKVISQEAHTISIPEALFFVFSFQGTGNVRVQDQSGTTDYILYGTGVKKTVWKVFESTSLHFTFTVSGTVTCTQIEPIGLEFQTNPLDYLRPTSWIPNLTEAVTTREEETFFPSGGIVEYSDRYGRNLNFVESVQGFDIQGTTYFVGEQRQLNKKVYECIVETTSLPTEQDDDLNWVYVRPTNDIAMLDLTTTFGSSILAEGCFVYIVKGKLLDHVSLLEVDADDIDLSITKFSRAGSATSLVHRDIFENEAGPDFFNTDNMRNIHASLDDEEIYPFGDYGTIVSFRISSVRDKATGDFFPSNERIVKAGELLFGKDHATGDCLYGVSTSIKDYSTTEIDVLGYRRFIKRGFSKRVAGDILIDYSENNRVLSLLYSLRGEPALWIFSEREVDNVGLIVFGVYNSFSLKIAYPTKNVYNINIEGLTI